MVDVILDEKSTNIDGFRLGMSSLVCRMMIELIHTNENDVVYDPFMGSGTTAIASYTQRLEEIILEVR